MKDHFRRDTARGLTRLYAIALLVVAVLTVLSQGLVQLALHGQSHDATVVNLAGRQRMLSQRLCKAALAWRLGDPTAQPAALAEVSAVLADWTANHERLARGRQDTHAGINNSRAVAAAFADLDPLVTAMAAAARRIGSDPAAVTDLLSNEDSFLRRMEAIVGIYEHESADRVVRLIVIELGLCGALLVVLAAEAWFVFRPAVGRLAQAMSDRERLQRQELATRELVTASAVAREIGMDLHDGLGQSMTALSLRASGLARRLADHPEAAEVAAMAEGISLAIIQARALARRLVPVGVRMGEMSSALRELAQATERASGITVTLSERGTWPVWASDDTYRIVQEAITNALRHSRARSITIELAQDEHGAVLRIADDGVARRRSDDPDQGNLPERHAEGVGTRSMHYRAERLGGTLAVGLATDGRGWVVELRLPPRLAGTPVAMLAQASA